MSSSEDEFCYTNTKSLLTKKFFEATNNVISIEDSPNKKDLKNSMITTHTFAENLLNQQHLNDSVISIGSDLNDVSVTSKTNINISHTTELLSTSEENSDLEDIPLTYRTNKNNDLDDTTLSSQINNIYNDLNNTLLTPQTNNKVVRRSKRLLNKNQQLNYGRRRNSKKSKKSNILQSKKQVSSKVIVIGSDDEYEKYEKQVQNSNTVQGSGDLDNGPLLKKMKTDKDGLDVNYEITVNVWWQFNDIQKFNIRKFQKLKQIFDFYAERENVPLNRLYFSAKGVVFKPSNSPDDINLESGTIIEGGILTNDLNVSLDETNVDKNTIQLKVQCKDLKKPILINIGKMQKMIVLMSKCAEELNTNIDNLKFYFDGELIDPSAYPSTLDLEDGECIDLYKK